MEQAILREAPLRGTGLLGPTWTRMQDQPHPTEAEWSLFLDRRVSQAEGHRMAIHLERCPACAQIVYRLPPPVYRCLGRPVAPCVGWNPLEMEDQAQALVGRCLELLPSGGALVVAADWWDEALLLRLLSILVNRLRKKELSVEVCGYAYSSPEPPSRPGCQVGVLLGASNYDRLSGWRDIVPNRLTILAAREGDRTLVPDVALASPIEVAERQLAKHRETIASTLAAWADPLLRYGVLCCACACDLPPGFFAGPELPRPFAAIEDPATDERLGWASVDGGQGLAQSVVAEYYRSDPEKLVGEMQAAIDYVRNLGDAGEYTARRLESRLRLWLSSLYSIDTSVSGW